MADPTTERDPLEVLAAEFMERLRLGQHPSVEEYAAQNPDLSAEILDLFPTIAATERLKARQERSSGGRATLGPARLERLGDFRLIREIGRGGMGVVFEAEHESLGRRVALKVLPRQALLDEKHLKRFQRESRVAANLHHTNIVEVFGVGEQDGFHYYVMQFIEGVGLETVVAELGTITQKPTGGEPANHALTTAAVQHLLGEDCAPDRKLGPHYWRSVAKIGWQCADALSYAHAQGTLHRDIKPANLLLDSHGTVWLADFGLAKAAKSEDISLSSDVVGTLRYMAPEQFRGSTDQRSDIYSLGLTLYELLTLRPAYSETDHSHLIQRITEGPPASPSSINPGIPADLETIILKAISHEDSQRYQSAEALADDLRCFLEDRPIQARRAGPVERLGRWCRRNPVIASLAGSTSLLLVLVAVVASIGYVRTKTALRGEAVERAKAEANARLAMEALDHIFDRFSPARTRILPQLSMLGAGGQSIELPNAPVLSKEAAALLEEMLPFYDRLAGQTGNDAKLRARTAEANRRVGAIRQRLGQLDAAAKSYTRAVALYRELMAEFPGKPDLKLETARTENELGRLHTSQRKVDEARQAHLAALELLQADASQTSAPAELRFELARTCYFLGAQERPLPTAGSQRQASPNPVPDEHRDRLAQAVALLKSLSATPTANPDYQHLLALCYLEGASVAEAGRQGGQAGDELAIEILESLMKAAPNVTDYAYDLSEAYARIHIPRPPVPREIEENIADRFSKSLAILRTLVLQHPDVPDFLAAEARIHDKLGAFHRQRDRWEEAGRSFRQAVTIQSALVKQFPDSPYYSLWLATFRLALADALLRRDDINEARAELDTAIAMLSRLSAQQPNLKCFHDMLANAYLQQEAIFRRSGDWQKAEEAARKARQVKPNQSSLPDTFTQPPDGGR